MLLKVDVLVRLGKGAQTPESLASILPASGDEVQVVLHELASQGLVTPGSGGYEDPTTRKAIYTVSPSGRKAYGAAIDRYAAELTGWPSMGVLERLLFALAHHTPSSVAQQHVVQLADDDRFARVSETGERGRATRLVLAALEWAALALDASGPENTSSAEALRSIVSAVAEEFAYPAERIRQAYAPLVGEGHAHDCLLGVAAAAEALYETRPMQPGAGKVSVDREIAESAFLPVADHVAEALAAAGRGGLVDPVAKAQELVEDAAAQSPI